jgi:hypothetical protein
VMFTMTGRLGIEILQRKWLMSIKQKSC